MSENAVAALGLLVSEAAERLVDEHDESLDKRAALMKIESPTFQNIENVLRFEFRVKGNRQPEVTSAIEIAPEIDPEEEPDFSALGTSLSAVPSCTCDVFPAQSQCCHTLAISWWLQEQLGRRSISDVFEFFSELKVDTVAAGRELVSEILSLAEQSAQPPDVSDQSQLQWRIRLSTSTYYSPIAITAYEQRPRKNGKGWTKGREVRSYDLLKRDFSSFPVDGRVAALASTSSYSFEDEYFTEFQALEQLVGHPNVAWDDSDATPIQVYSAELALGLTPVEPDTAEADGQPAEHSPGDEDEAEGLGKVLAIPSRTQIIGIQHRPDNMQRHFRLSQSKRSLGCLGRSQK